MRYAIPFLLFLCSCQVQDYRPVVDIPPEFQEYVHNFVEESVTQGRPVSINNLIVRFSDGLDDNILGECWMGQQRKILINVKYWPGSSLLYKHVLMYHELGHCVLNRDHVETGRIYDGTCSATSIMWPYLNNDIQMYEHNWDAYMYELFNAVPVPANMCYYGGYWGG